MDWNSLGREHFRSFSVTPFVGVWIETLQWRGAIAYALSHPSWVCGLKHDRRVEAIWKTSHTLRGCVDWNRNNFAEDLNILSHTLRGCVDWNNVDPEEEEDIPVTPFVGVWIETLIRLQMRFIRMSHPSWVCGLKHQTYGAAVEGFVSHPSWVCGLKLRYARYRHRWEVVTPFVGVWNETENRFYFLSPLEKVIFTKTCHWLSISYKDKKYDSGLF